MSESSRNSLLNRRDCESPAIRPAAFDPTISDLTPVDLANFDSSLYELDLQDLNLQDLDSQDSTDSSTSSGTMPDPESPLYGPGGFFPVHLNDILNSRYRIVHKLGHGDDSTVWLAYFEQPTTPPTTPHLLKDTKSAHQPRYLTIKILRASLSADKDQTIPELSIFEHLKLQSRFRATSQPKIEGLPHPGEAHVVRLVETFEVKSANGTHLCLVMPFAGVCLRDVQNLEYWKRKDIGRQLATGVAYLHEMGVCHGDLTATNVLVDLDIAQGWTVEELYANLGAPQKVPFPSTAELGPLGAPGGGLTACNSEDTSNSSAARSTPCYTVPPISISKLPTYLLGIHVTIIDLGRAFIFDDESPPIPRPHVPIFYPAPESVFNMPITKTVDVWFLSCLIFQIYTGEILFQGPFYGGFQKNANEVAAVRALREVMGAVPGDIDGSEAMATAEERGKAVMRSVRSIPKGLLLWRFERAVGTMDAQEVRDVWGLMGGMLMFNPKLRISAEEASEHRWFTY